MHPKSAHVTRFGQGIQKIGEKRNNKWESLHQLIIATVSGTTVTLPELKVTKAISILTNRHRGTSMAQVQILALLLFIVVGMDPCLCVCKCILCMVTLAWVCCTWVLRT